MEILRNEKPEFLLESNLKPILLDLVKFPSGSTISIGELGQRIATLLKYVIYILKIF